MLDSTATILAIIQIISNNIAMMDNSNDMRLLAHLIDEMNKATMRAEKAIDETLDFVDKSNKRIERMEYQASLFTKSPRNLTS